MKNGLKKCLLDFFGFTLFDIKHATVEAVSSATTLRTFKVFDFR